MRKRYIYLIIVITSVALLGTILIEYFWIHKIIRYQEEQFSNSVNVGLKAAGNRLFHLSSDSIEALFDGEGEKVVTHTELDIVDSLIRREFVSLDLPLNYISGIYDSKNGKLYTNAPSGYYEKLNKSNFSIPISCPMRKDRFYLATYFPDRSSVIRDRTQMWFILAALFIVILIVTFSLAISLLFRQKRLSAMKTDFVNNLTHELKTPMSTISLASEMLLNSGINGNPNKIERYAKIIYNENTRLQNQVERVLQIAVLDKGDFKLRKKPTDIHELLEQVMHSFAILIQKREGRFLVCFEATQSTILGDRVHLLNIFTNLVDNANKYSPEKPVITLATKNTKQGILITVLDRGIGIGDENQHHVFKNLYRVPTGNLHDVKGFGMGLYYAKKVVEAHGGNIKLKSTLGKGSRFEVFLPFEHQESNENDNEYKEKHFAG